MNSTHQLWRRLRLTDAAVGGFLSMFFSPPTVCTVVITENGISHLNLRFSKDTKNWRDFFFQHQVVGFRTPHLLPLLAKKYTNITLYVWLSLFLCVFLFLTLFSCFRFFSSFRFLLIVVLAFFALAVTQILTAAIWELQQPKQRQNKGDVWFEPFTQI